MDEVLSHPFFKDINFEKLLKKEIEPEFKPVVTPGTLDLTHFD
jgi:hypothetical protein